MGEARGVWIGASFIGEAAAAAHVSVVPGDRGGSVGASVADAAAAPERPVNPYLEAPDVAAPPAGP